MLTESRGSTYRRKALWIIQPFAKNLANSFAKTAGNFRGKFAVACGGLYSDRLVKASGQRPAAKIIPFRGEYFQIKKERQFLVRHLIYPVPDPKFPFLGVHFTRMVRGGVEAGPNAVLAFAREGYKKTNVNIADLADT